MIPAHHQPPAPHDAYSGNPWHTQAEHEDKAQDDGKAEGGDGEKDDAKDAQPGYHYGYPPVGPHGPHGPGAYPAGPHGPGAYPAGPHGHPSSPQAPAGPSYPYGPAPPIQPHQYHGSGYDGKGVPPGPGAPWPKPHGEPKEEKADFVYDLRTGTTKEDLEKDGITLEVGQTAKLILKQNLSTGYTVMGNEEAAEDIYTIE